VRSTTLSAGILMGLTLVAGCSKEDSSAGAGATDSSSSRSGMAPATTASNTSNDTIVRGTLKVVSDSALTLTTPSGDVRVALTPPVKVYSRGPADLSRVTDHVFIGVTSVPQPDGSQRATEIHIFPEELRGLGEGSRPMAAPSGGSARTMTNGSVSGSRMTNGSATMTNGSATMTNGAARMTNGASGGVAGGTLTVQYNGGSQTITVPSNVSVTEIKATSAKLSPGAIATIPATKRPDGTLATSRVMLAAGQPPK
jgi:hypothetical protein